MSMGFMVAAASRKRDDKGRYMGADDDRRVAHDAPRDDWRPWPEPHMPPYLDETRDNIRPGHERREELDAGHRRYMMRDRNVVNIRDYQDRRKIGYGESREHEHQGDAHHKGAYPRGEHRLTKEMAEEWVEGLQNADPEHPTGAKWSMDVIRPIAAKNGFVTPEKQLEFWAVINMMYSDYAETAKKHGVCTIDFFADMAKSWIKDKDAVEDKTAAYIECCTK